MSNRGARCGAEVTYAVRNGTGKIQFGHTVHYSCDVGHTIDKGVLDALTQWTVSCDTGGVLVLSIEMHGAVCR